MATCNSDIAIPVNDRRTRVTFQVQTTTPDDSGGASVATWTDVSTAWVKMEQWKGWEKYTQQALINHSIWKFSGLYSDLKYITVAHRILVGQTKYNIRGINNVNMYNVTIKIEAEEGVTQ